MEMVERILLLQLESEMDGWKSRERFPFLTSRAPPIGDERSSVCQLCQKQHDLGKRD